LNAIAGIVSLGSKPIEPGNIEKLTQATIPDGCRSSVYWNRENASFGYNSHSFSQPSLLDESGLVLLFDGRLDNRAELRQFLRKKGFDSSLSRDSEIVAAAYRHWGDECPGNLLGDFAFALWDKRHKRLFCARDPCGARPFYFTCTAHYFAFASSDEALAQLPGVSGRPCEELIAFYFVRVFQDVEPEQTWLENVSTLLPASSLVVTPAGAEKQKKYWRYEDRGVDDSLSDGECKEAFLNVFKEAVQCRLNDVAVTAAMISGGMDSAGLAATLAGLANELPGGVYHSYSAISDDVDGDIESRSIASLTKPGFVHTHNLGVPSLEGQVGIEDLKEKAWGHAHPLENSILIPSMMCLAASRNGHPVLLHAASGDLAMGSYPSYMALLLKGGQWKLAGQEALAAAQNHTYLRDQRPSQLLFRAAWNSYVPGKVRQVVDGFRKGRLFDPEGLDLLNPDFAKKLRLMERIRANAAPYMADKEFQSRRAHISSTFGPAGVANTLSAAQRVGSLYGVETSDPWADKRVLEFLLRVPVNQLVRNGWIKYLARISFSPMLESWVCWRNDKEHLGWLLTSRLLQDSEEFIEHTLNEELHLVEGFVNMATAQRIYSRYKKQNDDVAKSQIFELMTIVLWVKRMSS
jgi:asparagine synthase (glutamine-hydrolysing)